MNCFDISFRKHIIPSRHTFYNIDPIKHDLFKNTVLGCTFNTMGSERYILTENNKELRDLAAHAPYDAIYIMINHPRYGGGGIYNLYCTFTTGNQFKDYLFLHEFGHLQTLPVAVMHALWLLANGRWRRRGLWGILAAIAAHQAVWELASESYVIVKSRGEYGSIYRDYPNPAGQGAFWSFMFSLAISLTRWLTKNDDT